MSLKEKLVEKLGAVGFFINYFLLISVSILPVVMIGINSFIFYIIVFTLLIFLPFPTEQIVWIWGLIGAIKGEQDFLAILFYILFAIQAIRYIFAFISTLKK